MPENTGPCSSSVYQPLGDFLKTAPRNRCASHSRRSQAYPSAGRSRLTPTASRAGGTTPRSGRTNAHGWMRAGAALRLAGTNYSVHPTITDQRRRVTRQQSSLFGMERASASQGILHSVVLTCLFPHCVSSKARASRQTCPAATSLGCFGAPHAGERGFRHRTTLLRPWLDSLSP